MIVGIVGTLGAGKGTVVDYLVREKGFRHYSSSGLLKEILTERGETIDRDALAALAREIRAKDPDGVPKRTYERYLKEKPEHAILEALHTVGEVEFIKSVGGMILGVDADVHIRYERIKRRGSEKDDVTFEKFLEQTRREEDTQSDEAGHNIRGALALANAIIMNNGTLEELHARIDEILH